MRTEKTENEILYRSNDGELYNSKKEARKADRDWKTQQRDGAIASLTEEQQHRFSMHYSYAYYGSTWMTSSPDPDYIYRLISQEERMSKRYWAIFSYADCCSTQYGIYEFDELEDLQQSMNDSIDINLDSVLDTQTWQSAPVEIDVKISLQWKE